MRVGLFDGKPRIQVASADGSFGLETDGANRWWWIGRRVTFGFKPLYAEAGRSRLRLRFQYAARQDKPLRLEITGGSTEPPFAVELSNHGGVGEFSHDVEVDQIRDLKVSIGTEAVAERLGDSDPRKAAFIIRNLALEQQ